MDIAGRGTGPPGRSSADRDLRRTAGLAGIDPRLGGTGGHAGAGPQPGARLPPEASGGDGGTVADLAAALEQLTVASCWRRWWRGTATRLRRKPPSSVTGLISRPNETPC